MTSRSFIGTILSALLLAGCGASAVTPAESATDKAETTDASTLFHQGEQAAQSGDTVRAEQYLTMALERGYSEKKVLPIMLRVCLSSSRLRAALNHAQAYLREHTEDESLRYLVATIHLGLGQLDEARLELNHILRVNHNNPRAHYLLGVLESGADTEQASAHFHKYLAIAPSGEHALEVKSRLTDLAVQRDLDPKPEFIAVERPSAVTSDREISKTSAAVWFGDAATPASVPSKASEP